MAAEIEVALKLSDNSAPQITRVPYNPRESVRSLKDKILKTHGLQLKDGSRATMVLFGMELQDALSVQEAGLEVATGREWWASSFLYPNGWYKRSQRKLTLVVRDPTWPPIRPYSEPPLVVQLLPLVTHVSSTVLLAASLALASLLMPYFTA